MDGFPIISSRMKRPTASDALSSGWQRTIGGTVRCQGVGVHSGKDVTLAIRPAPANSGITFVRTDEAADRNVIPARYDMVADTRLCTLLRNAAGVSVGTVEHLMSALAALSIDNAIVELDGSEVPILDGSAAPFVALLRAGGIVEQNRLRSYIQILKPVAVTDGAKSARLRPASAPFYGVEIDFPGTVIGRQRATLDFGAEQFENDIASARTFGFLHEVDYLRSQGLGRGGSLDNAVVVDGARVLNEDGLRFENEFARHKLLDAVGDLALAGAPIMGAFEGVQTGHALNNKLLHALFANASNWRHATVLDSAMIPHAPVEALAVAI